MLSRGLHFTDIHFGKKSNSPVHLQDCTNFIDWVCDYVKDPSNNIDYIAFLGDWFENRININIFTLQTSHENAEKLNNLGVPVYFVVGNHDLAERNSREYYSTFPMSAFDNFVIVDEPMERTEIVGGVLFSPFLMKDEYSKLSSSCAVWAGHFEFKGFILTGSSVRLEHGPDASAFSHVRAILSGHFHKRQSSGNVHYIGNTFPMDFGDSRDYERGFAVYDHNLHTIEYVNWVNGPRYLSTTVSRLKDGTDTIPANAHVYVDVDCSLSYSDLRALQDSLRTSHPTIRSLEFNENSTNIKELAQLNATGDLAVLEDSVTTQTVTSTALGDIIMNLLQTTDIPSYDNALLLDIYKEVV